MRNLLASISFAYVGIEASAIAGARGDGALLLTISQIGNASSWITSTARLPFVAGIDRYLPPAFDRVHRRWHSPYVALLVQAVLTSLALIAAMAGNTLREAFQILLDATFVLAFLPLLYMFAAWPRLRRAGTGVVSTSVCRCIAAIGFAVTSLAIVLAFIPPPEAEHPMLFLVKVSLGSAALIGVGIGQFMRARRRGRTSVNSSAR